MFEIKVHKPPQRIPTFYNKLQSGQPQPQRKYTHYINAIYFNTLEIINTPEQSTLLTDKEHDGHTGFFITIHRDSHKGPKA